MLKLEKWKKVVFLAAAAIVLVRILYICVGGEVDKVYSVSAWVDTSSAAEIACKNLSETFSSDQKRLNSLELIFSGIAGDETGFVALKIMSQDELIYQTNLTLAGINNYEWKKVFVNAELDPKREYEIQLNASDDCVQVPNVLLVSGDNAPPEAISSYADENVMEGEIAVRYGYLAPPGRLDIAVMASLCLIFLGAVLAFLYYFNSIKQTFRKFSEYVFTQINREVFFVVAEIFGGLVIVNASGIEFQPATKILLYLISVCSAVKFDEKRRFVRALCHTAARRCFLYLLYVYAAFALVGQRILVYPLDIKVAATGVFAFFVAILWFVPVMQTLFCLFEKLGVVSFSHQRGLKTVCFVGIALFFLLAPAAYNLFANNPGITSLDTYDSMVTNAHHLRGMMDWHPAFYCMILSAILTVWDSTYAVILVQYFFWAYVMMEMLLYLRKKGVKDAVLLGAALFIGTNAANFLHINTIWKDIPYAISLLWALILLARLSLDFEEYKKKWYIYAELVIALTGVFFYRKNGIISFLVIAVMAAVVLRKNVKVWASLALTCALIFVIKGPVYSYFEVQDTGRVGMYVGLSQDILGVYYSEGEVSEDTLRMVNVMTSYNNAEYDYIPTWANQNYHLNVEPTEFILNYIDTFVKNPVLMTRAVIAREDALWNIYPGQDSFINIVNFHETNDGYLDWNDYYPQRVYRTLYPLMSAVTGYTASSQWVSSIVWRGGLFTLLGLAAVLFMAFKRGIKKYMLITAPVIGHILSLLLSTGWSDFRYFWPLNLMNMAVLLFMLVVTSKNAGESE